MMAVEAVEQIRDTIFKPGWRFRAKQTGMHKIEVELFIDTVNTSYPSPSGQYEVPWLTGGDLEIDTYGLDAEGLCYRLLRMAELIDSHENREFLRVRQSDGSWKALLHPHDDACEARWVKLVSNDPTRNMDRAAMVAAMLDELLGAGR